MSDGGDSDGRPDLPREPRCAQCGKPREEKYRPFCSKRCADLDLARWLGGGYVIAGGNQDADEDGDAGPGSDRETPHADD